MYYGLGDIYHTTWWGYILFHKYYLPEMLLISQVLTVASSLIINNKIDLKLIRSSQVNTEVEGQVLFGSLRI